MDTLIWLNPYCIIDTAKRHAFNNGEIHLELVVSLVTAQIAIWQLLDFSDMYFVVCTF